MQQLRVTTLSSESIDKFRSSLSVRGRSEHTMKAYCGDLKAFLLDCREPEISMEEFEELGMSWLQLNRRILAPKTTRRRLTSLRAFGKWAGMSGVALEEYAAPVPAKGQPHPVPEGMDGIRRIIEATDNEKQRALVALCGYVGCRVAEALQVKPSDFDLRNMKLTIRGKGDKTRVVPVSQRAWEVLAGSIGRAFVSGDAEVVGLRDRFARRVITELGEKAGLKRRIASHDLRATLATYVYDKTRNFRLVQEIMGHASSKTTELYIGVEFEAIRGAMEIDE